MQFNHRGLFALSVLVCLVAVATAATSAAPTVVHLSGGVGRASVRALTNSTGAQELYYFSIDVPQNTYFLNLNASFDTGYCSRNGSSSAPIPFSLTYSRVMLCSPEYVASFQNYDGTSPLVACDFNQGGADDRRYWNDDWYLGYSTYNTSGVFIGPYQIRPEFDNNVAYIQQATSFPVLPGTTIYGHLNRYMDNDDDYETACDVKMTMSSLTCPTGTLPYKNDVESTADGCVTAQEVTATSTNTTINVPAVTVPNVGHVVHIASIPSTANSITFTVTTNSTSASVAGAFFPVSALPGASDAVDCKYRYSSGPAARSDDITFSVTCYAPRWNKDYYFSMMDTTGIPALWQVSFVVNGCPAGKTGVYCTDDLTALTGAQTYVGSAPSGCAHWYLDVPANTWTDGILNVTGSNSTAGLFIRDNTYSNYFSTPNTNNYDSTYSSVVSTRGLISTPYERYSPEAKRWVISYCCSTFPCDYEVNFGGSVSVTTPQASTNPPPTGSASSLAPFSAVLLALVALVALFF